MAMPIFEVDRICPSCKGTGLYVGFAEPAGCAVVCSTCKGSGCHHFKLEYEEFVSRASRDDVSRVLRGNQTGSCSGGMPYSEWAQGLPFPKGSEDRGGTCPAWWYQNVDYTRKPKWVECGLGGTFSECPSFGDKAACWKRWDAEFGAD